MISDGQLNSLYGSISVIKVLEDIGSTNVEFTHLIHDPKNVNGTTFSHYALTRKIANFTMKNTQTPTYYGSNLQNEFNVTFKTVTFWDRNVRVFKKWSR